MTESVAFVRPKTARYLVAVAALGVFGALSPAALAAPAAAAPAGAGCPGGFGATAASNTLAVDGVDLRAVGLNLPPLPELRAATTYSGFAGGPSRAAADARYIQSRGVLGPAAYQQAPPPHERPTVVPVEGVNLGALSAGSGGLRAHATWNDTVHCTPAAGPRATAAARLSGISVLPGRGGRALLRFAAIQSGTTTEVGKLDGKAAASATATGTIADFALLTGGPAAIGVRVISPPSLRVLAGGAKSVEYTAPVLQVTVAGTSPVKVASAGSHVDVVVPIDGASRAAAEDLARTENLPVAAGLPLTDLLSGATSVLSGGLGGKTESTPESILIGLPGLPEVGRTEGGAVHTPEGAKSGRVVVLRIELGSVQQQSSATGVYAKADSIRVKLIVRTKWKSASDNGYGHDDHGQLDQTTVLELGVCSLEAAAAAPNKGGYGYGGVSGGDTLPVTGSSTAVVLGAGLLLLVAGSLLVVLSRRRSS